MISEQQTIGATVAEKGLPPWLNALDQIQRTYTFAVDHDNREIVDERECPCCKKMFEVRLKHKMQKFCSRFCCALQKRIDGRNAKLSPQYPHSEDAP